MLDRIAFVGGCATGIYLSDPAAAPVRSTLDVDAIVEIASYAEFVALEDRLGELGFRRAHAEAAPICRWLAGDLTLDLMPTDSTILGFSNRWYRPALYNAQTVPIGNHNVRIITAPYFLATKLEAFHGRGNRDYRMSRDLEDIVTVIDGRPELVEEVSLSEPALRQYLSDEFRLLLSNPEFRDALPGHLLPDAANQQRLGLIVERIHQIIMLSAERDATT
ncbi:MAG: hypothetical protein ACLQBK_14800 [Candidatus Sulfotelmatobacter sp.]